MVKYERFWQPDARTPGSPRIHRAPPLDVNHLDSHGRVKAGPRGTGGVNASFIRIYPAGDTSKKKDTSILQQDAKATSPLS